MCIFLIFFGGGEGPSFPLSGVPVKANTGGDCFVISSPSRVGVEKKRKSGKEKKKKVKKKKIESTNSREIFGRG